MLILRIILTSVVFVQPGSNMVNRVIRRGDHIRLTCDELDSSLAASTQISSFSNVTNLSWFMKPFNGTRVMLSNSRDVKQEFSGIFRIVSLPEMPGDYALESLNASLIPGGTYDCFKRENEIKILSELVVLETEPICDLVLQEGKGGVKAPLDGNVPSNDRNVTRKMAVMDGSCIRIVCKVFYYGNLGAVLRLSLDGQIAATNRSGTGKHGQQCDMTVTFNATFNRSPHIEVGLSLAFEPFNESTSRNGITLTNIPVYDLNFHLQLHSDDTKPETKWDVSTIGIIGVLIGVVVLILVAFSACYFLLSKKIKYIQEQSTNVSGGSMPFAKGDERISSLYDEINPDEEQPGFFLKAKPYAPLDQSTMTKNKLTGTDIVPNPYCKLNAGSSTVKVECPSPPGQGETTTEVARNVYLDLVSSYVLMNPKSSEPPTGSASSEYVTHNKEKETLKVAGVNFLRPRAELSSHTSSSVSSSSPPPYGAAGVGSKPSSPFVTDNVRVDHVIDDLSDDKFKSGSFVYQNDA